MRRGLGPDVAATFSYCVVRDVCSVGGISQHMTDYTIGASGRFSLKQGCYYRAEDVAGALRNEDKTAIIRLSREDHQYRLSESIAAKPGWPAMNADCLHGPILVCLH